MTKICTRCQVEKPLDQFRKRTDRPNGVLSRCRACFKYVNAESYKRRTERDPDYARRNSLKAALKRYGISVEEYERMHKEQEGKCAICRLPEKMRARRLAVDHCHKTGKVRGLLCVNCNTGLGGLGDDIDTVFAAAAYLLSHESALEESSR